MIVYTQKLLGLIQQSLLRKRSMLGLQSYNDKKFNLPGT